MSKTIKRALSLFLCTVLLFGALPLTAVHAADPTSGTCGENLTWSYNTSTKTLTISGTGEMEDYGEDSAPWEPYCESIRNLAIGNGVASIGGDAFWDCSGLTSVTIPASVASIGDMAFAHCAKLKSVTIPDSVTHIGMGAFDGTAYYNNDSNWVNKVLYIGNHLIAVKEGFSGFCEIRPGTKTLADFAFVGCEGLTSVTIPNSVTSIGMMAFSNCDSLTSVTIPDSVTSIGEIAFSMCTNLTFIHIPSSVTSIGDDAFSFCDSLSYICSDTANCYAKTYAESNGIEFRVCSGHGTGCALNGHTPKVVRIEPTCMNPGAEYTICEACGETISGITTIPANGHTPGEWQTVKEPTETETGKAEKRCTVCGETLEEKELPKLEVVKDETTGIELSYSGGDYNGDVSVNVEQSFDGAAFNLVNTQTSAVQQAVYDITLSVNGAETQPNGKIKVKIPVPAGYDPAKTFVYHVNTATGKLEKMNAVYENGFMVFETDHFSFYAIVEAAPKVTKVELGDVTMNYKDSVTLKPTITADPGAEYTVKYESSNPKVATVDANGKVTGAKRGSATITCTVTDGSGNTVKDTCTVTVKYTVLQWIIIILLFGWIWY